MTTDHRNSILHGEKPKYDLACINCLAAGMSHTHNATDQLCPFFMERNNKKNITSLLATIRTRRLEGYENPFGLTKVRHASATSSYNSSTAARKHLPKTGNFPTQFLAQQEVVSSNSGSSSLQLASSNDSLFKHVPDITASQAELATYNDTSGNITSL